MSWNPTAPEQKQAVLAQYLGGLERALIGRNTGLTRSTVARTLKKFRNDGLITGYRRSSHQTKRCSLLTPHQMEVIDGLLLGDGCIRIPKNNMNAVLTTSCIHRSFIEHIREELSPIVFPKIQVKAANDRIFPGGKLGHCKPSYIIGSLTDKTLTPIHHRWHRDGRQKQIPADLIVTPTVMYYWFCGDGSTTHKNNNNLGLSLATQGFTVAECDFLVTRVEEAIGVTFTRRGDKLPILDLHRGPDVNKVLDWMLDGSEPPECFRYKWKRFVSRGPVCGERHPSAKLSEDDVRAIHHLHADGWTNSMIAKRFGIDSSYVSQITSGKKWRRVWQSL